MPAPPGLLLGTTLMVTLLLSSCSGNPIGERLAAGFDPPAPAPSSPPPFAPSQPSSSAPAPVRASPPAAPTTPPKPTPPAPKAVVLAKPTSAAKPVAAKTSTAKPAAGSGSVPYRVTLKLPAADPAAPAEAVTEALRAAGVRFEVETIERIRSTSPLAGGSSGGPAPVSSPAPAPR